MNKKHFAQVALLYLIAFIIGTLFFIFLFHTPLFSSISIFFYKGVVFLFPVSFLTALVLMYLRKKIFSNLITIRDIILLPIIIFCLNLVFFTHFPVTAERSVSVFLLGYLNNRSEKTLTESEIRNDFIKKFLNENRALENRLNEQIVSGKYN